MCVLPRDRPQWICSSEFDNKSIPDREGGIKSKSLIFQWFRLDFWATSALFSTDAEGRSLGGSLANIFYGKRSRSVLGKKPASDPHRHDDVAIVIALFFSGAD